MSKPIRVPRDVQRAAYRIMWEMLRQAKDDAVGITNALDEQFGDGGPDMDVACEAWNRACEALIDIADKRAQPPENP